MKVLKSVISFIAILSLVVLAGCSTRYGQLTVASTKNIDINKKEYEKVKSDVVGVSKVPVIIIIPMGEPSIEDAIDAALKEAGGDLMQNVVIYYKWFYIPYIYGEYKFEVKGDVYRLKNNVSSVDLLNVDPNAAIITVEKVGDEFIAKKLK